MASPEDMRNLSMQFKNNAEDLQAFCRDLSNWTKEVNAADKQLLEAKARKRTNQGDVPPIRNATTPSSPSRKRKESDKNNEVAVAAKKKEEVQSQSNPHRIKSYEFDRWDKFDVSKALEELDKDDEGESDEEEDSDEDMNAARLLEQALVEKDKGNALFRQGKLDAAIEAYTRAMACDTRNAVLPANRAMALIKKGLMAAAEADCSVAIDIDATYAKARNNALLRLRFLCQIFFAFSQRLPMRLE
jgi:tetratricopeptide (TPR) repeat protein